MTRNMLWLACVALLWSGCGGGDKNVEAPADDGVSAAEESESGDEGDLVPEEKFQEIRYTFERKSSLLSRCFPEAVEAGDLDAGDKVKLTIGLTIQTDGSPKDVHIVETTKKSATVDACVKRTVGRWQFTTLPKPLPYSYGLILQDF